MKDVTVVVLDHPIGLREDAAVHDDVGARRQVGQRHDGAADIEVRIRGLEGCGPHRASEGDDFSGFERHGLDRERGFPERVCAVGHKDVRLWRRRHGGDDGVPVAVRELQGILAADFHKGRLVSALNLTEEGLTHGRRADKVARQRAVRLVDGPARCHHKEVKHDDDGLGP